MKLLKILIPVLLLSYPAFSDSLKTVFSPFTGKPDYINNITSSTLPSTIGLVANQCVQTNAANQLTSSGGACGGGGSTNGTVSASPQFNIPYYSLPGSSTTVVGDNNITTNGTGNLTASTTTAKGGVYGDASSVGGPNGSSLTHGAYMTVSSSGTSQALTVIANGNPSGGAQNQIGAVNIYGPNFPSDSGNSPALMVIADSTTNNTNGAGLLEIWEDNPAHDSYLLWIHGSSQRNSDEPIRFDGPTFGIDEVNTSTDMAHGLGKWKVISEAYQGVDSQIASSRAWDNTTFENLLYAHRLSATDFPPGAYLNPQSLADDSGVLTSSDTSAFGWGTLNGHTVGLTAPLSPTASWTFALPSTFNNLGQVLYQSDNGRGNNFNARSWAFTTGGTTGNVLQYNSGGAPTWVTPSSGSSVYPATSTIVASQGITGSTFTFTGPSQSTVTYGLTVGTLTVTSPSGIIVTGGNNTGVMFQNGQALSNSSTFEWNGSTVSATNISATTRIADLGLTTNQCVQTDGSHNLSTTGSVCESSSSNDFIQNQSSVFQSASFLINGNGQVGGVMQADHYDYSGGLAVYMDGVGNQYVAYPSAVPSASGSDNLFIASGGSHLTSGIKNVCEGDSSVCLAITSGNGNVCIDDGSCQNITDGSDGVYIGLAAGQDVTHGNANNFIGNQTGSFVTTGGFNSCFGNASCADLVDGTMNVSVGATSMNNVAHVSSGTFIGASPDNVSNENANDSGVTALGFDAGFNTISSSISNATAIGYKAYATTSNTMQLGGAIGSGNEEQVLMSTFSANNGRVTGTETIGTLGISSATPVAPLAITDSTSDSSTVIINPTWNNSSEVFNGILENVTNTASSSSSNLLNLIVSGTSEFSVTRAGASIGQSLCTASICIDLTSKVYGSRFDVAPVNTFLGGSTTTGRAGGELDLTSILSTVNPGGLTVRTSTSSATISNSQGTGAMTVTISSNGWVALSTGAISSVSNENSRFSIQTSTSNEKYALTISTQIGVINQNNYEVAVTTAGHFTALVDSPTISTCGTGPTGKWTDQWGWITPGSGATACTITFALPYNNRPVCVVAPETESLVTGFTYTVSNTAITVSSLGSGSIFDYQCNGIGE